MEEKYGWDIPVTGILAGNLVRLGLLYQPEIYLKKNQEYRLIVGKSILGDEHICSALCTADDSFLCEL